jgi:hypothetical protein
MCCDIRADKAGLTKQGLELFSRGSAATCKPANTFIDLSLELNIDFSVDVKEYLHTDRYSRAVSVNRLTGHCDPGAEKGITTLRK